MRKGGKHDEEGAERMSLRILVSPDPRAVLLDGWRRGKPVLRVRGRKCGWSVERS